MSALDGVPREPDAPRRPEQVSVVMPTYNGAATIDAQLGALTAQTYGGTWEVVVADNGSRDGTVDIVTRWRDRLPGLRVVPVTTGQGVAYASNAGAAAAGGDLLVFCHQDDVAEPEWLDALVRAAGHHDAVGGANDYRALNDPLVTVWRPPYPDGALPVAMRFLPFAVGANVAVWRDVFEALGGWPEDSEYGGEDVELSWRIQLAGYHLGFAPDAVMHFRFRTDLSALRRQYLAFGRVEPHLYRRYRHAGVPRSSVVAALRTWAWGLARIGDLRGEPGRKGIWVRKMAYRWGRLMGSWEARVLYL